ncbi:MAG: DsrE/DsrF/DrsH-like family protein [Solobacterium sp.]|nr:DsrE/DsrF/DrsH-like family protein [Solobacterium sp.]
MAEYKTIQAEEFDALIGQDVTFVDLREPDEILVAGIDGALNIPFSKIGTGLDFIPSGKPAVVFCRVGDWSSEVAELLADRGIEAYHLEGGFQAYRTYLQETDPAKAEALSHAVETAVNPAAPVTEKTDEVKIDAKGLKCPGPIVKVADTIRELDEGTLVRVEATEDAFASDIAVWAERTGNPLQSLNVEDGVITAVLKKGSAVKESVSEVHPHEKTMVVFSGDLDKTIAAFIMANGAASMGRPVTIFFTFWGLNILRRPEKVNVKKDFIEKMFGFMMPRGTTKLGLSRMNMGGAGAKMIRYIMKKNGISSLEELIQDAIQHGVRLVACQMSMDIMGIRKEELIDGIELGGVATMLGSAENSDLTYFI